MLRLIPHAEEVDYLTALCSVCRDGTPAIFSKFIGDEQKVMHIGGAESFVPVCRKHY
jgi:hypothetical protein